MRRRSLLALTVIVLVCGFSSSQAAAVSYVYYSGTLTENYHNFGRCYYSIGSDCSTRDWWWSTGAYVSAADGSTLVALDNGPTIRGDFAFPGNAVWVSDHEVDMYGQNLRGSVTIWSATYSSLQWASVCKGSIDC